MNYRPAEFVFDDYRYKVDEVGKLQYQSAQTPFAYIWIPNASSMQSLKQSIHGDGWLKQFFDAYENACAPRHPVEVF